MANTPKSQDNYGDSLRNILTAIAEAQGQPGADIGGLLQLQMATIGLIKKGPQIPGMQQPGQPGQPGQPQPGQPQPGQPGMASPTNPMAGAMQPGGGAVNAQQVTPGLGMMSGHTAQMNNNPDELRRILQGQLAG